MKIPLPPRQLPVLMRELHERANRKRTYAVRMLYASALCGLFSLFYMPMVQASGVTGWGVLGAGSMLFNALVGLEFTGIYVFLPALTSGVISSEKEQGTLGLLLVTDLRPMEILLQKLGAALLPMACLMLTGLPLMGVCYTLGGLSPMDILSASYALFLTMLQVASLGLMMSSACSGTISSFIGTYVLGAGIYIAPAMLVSLGHTFGLDVLRLLDEAIAFSLFPPIAYARWHRDSFLALVFHTIPTWGSIAVYLLLARIFFIKRAFVPQRNMLLRIWKPVDEYLVWMNQEYANGIVLVKDRDEYPDKNPIAWREVKRKSLGKVRYLFRAFVILEVPTVFLTLFIVTGSGFAGSGSESPMTAVSAMLWPLAGIAILGSAVNLIGFERSRNTLDVLLTTPLTGKEIITQKMAGVWRLQLVLLVPIFTALVGQWWVESEPMHYTGGGFSFFWLLVGMAQAVLFLRVLAWICMSVGLFCRHRFRAVILALGLTVIWCFLPMALLGVLMVSTEIIDLGILEHWLHSSEDGIFFLTQVVSPFFNIVAIESGRYIELSRDSTAIGYLVGLLWHVGLLWWVRSICIGYADRGLGRIAQYSQQSKLPSSPRMPASDSATPV